MLKSVYVYDSEKEDLVRTPRPKGMHAECIYCDGSTPVQHQGEEKGFMVCWNCGAEWVDCAVWVQDDEYGY